LNKRSKALSKACAFLLISLTIQRTRLIRVLVLIKSLKKAKKLLRLSELRSSLLDLLKAKAFAKKFVVIAIVSSNLLAIINVSK
jgi:hypothetical protein